MIQQLRKALGEKDAQKSRLQDKGRVFGEVKLVALSDGLDAENLKRLLDEQKFISV